MKHDFGLYGMVRNRDGRDLPTYRCRDCHVFAGPDADRACKPMGRAD